MGLLNLLGRHLAHFLAQPRRRQLCPSTSDPAMLARALQRGDVLLVEGNSRFATAIKYLTQSTWSHAALYIGEEALVEGARPQPMLIDVDVEVGVRRIPLSDFAHQHTRICRPHGLTPAVVDQLIGFMRTRIGYSYDLKNVFDLARYLIRQPPVPCHMRRRLIALGSGEPTKAICSTLLAQAFESIRYPILPDVETVMDHAGGHEQRLEILHIRNYSLYTPRDFDVSPFFDIVKPRLQSNFDYLALQWSDEGSP
ncbi:YiiX/YebB-like N1pC/P60 family cysteine hydrolase [Stenotrophomonas sp. SY1]|uniref:YiiX/YebB-like N1pC/P60 family cysteine hydrolase n=1 Tax=Stenotrophomonas sp. SY1 TaxID=477235 RepID=UPI001E3C06EA|nr:YiiX/YebB-like N1pC/P60 family cysteine hydrolase [Stenotrophomonas sp. SY1]MCD9085776.1 lipo-like protein [Stenotrophomonas sp. SY1]